MSFRTMWWGCVSLLILAYIPDVFSSRVVFDSNHELLNKGVSNPHLCVWGTSKSASNVGECAKLCHAETSCLSFTFHHKVNQCQGHDVLLKVNDADLEQIDGAQYFFNAIVPTTTTTMATTTKKRGKFKFFK